MNRGTAYVLAAAVLWGTTGTAAALAPTVGALAIGAAAIGIGGLLQAVVALPAIHRSRSRLATQWPLIAVSSAATAVYPLAFYCSVHLAGVAIGTVVTIGSAPMAAALIEWRLDHRHPSRRWTVGAGIGLCGVAMLALAPSQAAHHGNDSHGGGALQLAGVGLGLLAGLTYALYTWGAGRIMNRGIESRAAMGAVFGTAGMLLIPVLVVTGAPIIASAHNLAVTAYLAVVPMFLGYLMFGTGLRTVSTTTATTLSLVESSAAALIATAVLHEPVPTPGWIGIALLFSSLAPMTGRRGVRAAVEVDRDAEGSRCQDDYPVGPRSEFSTVRRGARA